MRNALPVKSEGAPVAANLMHNVFRNAAKGQTRALAKLLRQLTRWEAPTQNHNRLSFFLTFIQLKIVFTNY